MKLGVAGIGNACNKIKAPHWNPSVSPEVGAGMLHWAPYTWEGPVSACQHSGDRWSTQLHMALKLYWAYQDGGGTDCHLQGSGVPFGTEQCSWDPGFNPMAAWVTHHQSGWVDLSESRQGGISVQLLKRTWQRLWTLGPHHHEWLIQLGSNHGSK